MGNLQIWNQVPDGSRLELSATGQGPFSVGARVVSDDNFEEEWFDAEIDPGPKKKLLASPRNYVVRVAIAFAGDASATISARIVKPDGTVHQNPYSFPASGNRSIVRATILITTLLDGNG